MAILARLQITPAADRRSSARRQLRLDSSLKASGDDVTIHDLSSTGMLIETAGALAPFDDLEIELPEAGTTHALVVWSSGAFYGCEFRDRLSQAVISASQLRSRPLAPAHSPPPLETSDMGRATEDPAADFPILDTVDEEKAPLGTRLRVIFGSAVMLWALIIWVIAWLARAIRG
nr:PilZ domain-containing protein [Sphingomonas sp.]